MTKISPLRVTVASLALGMTATFAPGLVAAAQNTDMLKLTGSASALNREETATDEFARRGRGADDGAGHTRGGGKGRGRGADDAPNHG